MLTFYLHGKGYWAPEERNPTHVEYDSVCL